MVISQLTVAKKVTKHEVWEIIRFLKNGKAPGPDLIEVVTFKMVFKTIPDIVLQ